MSSYLQVKYVSSIIHVVVNVLFEEKNKFLPRILNEQLEKCRADLSETRMQNARLSSQVSLFVRFRIIFFYVIINKFQSFFHLDLLSTTYFKRQALFLNLAHLKTRHYYRCTFLQLDHSAERYKILQGNAEGYRKEIAALQDRCQKSSTTMAKLELTIIQLKEVSFVICR